MRFNKLARRYADEGPRRICLFWLVGDSLRKAQEVPCNYP
jgi:hypothetical protein